MMITTIETIPGKEVGEVLGLVRGNTIQAKHIGNDIMAGLKSIIGGEISEYTNMLSSARDQATERMVKEATNLGADAIVCARYSTSQVMQGAAEILAYGTAVKFK